MVTLSITSSFSNIIDLLSLMHHVFLSVPTCCLSPEAVLSLVEGMCHSIHAIVKAVASLKSSYRTLFYPKRPRGIFVISDELGF